MARVILYSYISAVKIYCLCGTLPENNGLFLESVVVESAKTSRILLAKSRPDQRWKGLVVLVVESDRLFDELAKLIKHRLLLEAVAAAIDEAKRTANVTLVLP